MDDVHFRNPHPLLGVIGGLTIRIQCKAAEGETTYHPGTLQDLVAEKAIHFPWPRLKLTAIVMREDDYGTVYNFVHHFAITISQFGHRSLLGDGSLANDWLKPEYDPKIQGEWRDRRFGSMTFTDYHLLWEPFSKYAAKQ